MTNTQQDWEKEFSLWWGNHDNFQGGLSSNLVPYLKQFISTLLEQARKEAREEVADGGTIEGFFEQL